MKKLRRNCLAVGALFAILALALGSVNSADASRRHTRLLKSFPQKDSTVVESPKSIDLWFNEKVELGVTRVRLTNASGNPITVGAVKRSDEKDAPIVAPVTTELTDGVYTVNWSTSSADGHPVRGTFSFTVKR